MAEIFSTSFEGVGVEAGFGELVGTGCSLDWDNSDVARPTGGGDEIIESISASTGWRATAYKDLGPGGQPISYTRGYVQIKSHSLANTNVKIVMAGTDENNERTWEVNLYRYTDGKLYFVGGVWDDGDWRAPTALSSEVILDTWYRLEVEYDYTNTHWEFRVDGAKIEDLALTGSLREGLRYFAIGGQNGITTGIAMTMYGDLFKADDADWVGAETEGTIVPLWHHLNKNIGR